MARIILGYDHRGVDTASRIAEWCHKKKIEVDDESCDITGSVDYPEYAFKVVEKVVKCDSDTVGVLICGWGNGMVIAANKVIGARAALCTSRVQAEYARSHNNANVLVLSAEATGWGMMEEILDGFIKTKFSGDERHLRRIKIIKDYELGKNRSNDMDRKG